MQVRLLGAKECINRFDKIPAKTLNALASGVNKAAAVVEASAKMNCPVDTGNLRGSIHITPATIENKTVTAAVGTSVEYAPYVEFGTGRRGGYPYKTSLDLSYDKEWAGQVAQPFLGKALVDNESRISQIVANTVVKGSV